MHILSARNRSEFLATPELARFEFAQGESGLEPTLLIKGSTLLLKYIVQGADLRLGISQLEDRLLYALKISDDPDHPRVLWSILEDEAEKKALRAIMEGDPLQVFLFNELAVNVAWASRSIAAKNHPRNLIDAATTGNVDHSSFKGGASDLLDQWVDKPGSKSDVIPIEIPNPAAWNAVRSSYVTSHTTISSLDLFSTDEGDQQEQLAIWLTDSLQPWAAHKGPRVPKGTEGSRELTDVLLSYGNGAICIESKSLSILGREELPTRAKLERTVARHIKKAIKQLSGGIRKIREGATVTSQSGEVIVVERNQPVHGVVLVPELTIIREPDAYGAEVIRDFARATGGFLHILDTAELLRIVQAAETIASRSSDVSNMMAFDYYLLERAKIAVEAGTLCVQVLLRAEK